MNGLERKAVEKIRRALTHIEENIGKRQYWNALSWSIGLQDELMKAFDLRLKERGTDNPDDEHQPG